MSMEVPEEINWEAIKGDPVQLAAVLSQFHYPKDQLRRVGAVTKELRGERGWSPADLSRASTIPKNTVSVIESEGSNVTYKSLRRLSWGFRVPFSRLFGEEEALMNPDFTNFSFAERLDLIRLWKGEEKREQAAKLGIHDNVRKSLGRWLYPSERIVRNVVMNYEVAPSFLFGERKIILPG